MPPSLNAGTDTLKTSERPWKGSAILGNGNICAVYSDDERITAISKLKGIQHFYYKNYTADYIATTSFSLIDEVPVGSFLQRKDNKTIGMENFFTTITRTAVKSGSLASVRCFVHPKDAVILSLEVKGAKLSVAQKFEMLLRKTIITDRKTSLVSLRKQGNTALASWSNGTVIAVAPKFSKHILETSDSTISIYGKVKNKELLEVIITAADNIQDALGKIKSLKEETDLSKSASDYWTKWLEKGKMPEFKATTDENRKYLEYYKRNLYAVKSANLNGMIPADITGQFVTNNMPQLYPRDAMMAARVFLLTGHYEEAAGVIKFWTDPSIPQKSKGEFFARYDAYAKAVDAGSGARYDEPEWDANGYMIKLLDDYHNLTNQWLAEKDFIYEMADFLLGHIDKSGLLYEGGIVEWTGYLPSTNMTSSSALLTASRIAGALGDKDREEAYKKASDLISTSLVKTFDKKREILADVRYFGRKAEGNVSITSPSKDTLYLWDTSLNFGALWGFPDNEMLKKTNEFMQKNNVKANGGVQYFEAPDKGLAGYGGDLFFFTTPASAQYQMLYGDKKLAKIHIDWMINNSNIYGLMPERIYLDQSDCSPASPLSWCNAEFAASVLLYSAR
ncbi:MAG: hypothetical protein HF314_17940 [Ignavibacteria bacterium]|jgi:GH15 family glucan-1,4-alpha-glucosidase|nr:hypothetical protein [Ignavibacteria bacterium]MCU7504970.1 hypothetical protein [Ignavibacteria bacterium]MCU7514896.1 hypothetical protein [Ignavibacteria bacterium]